MVRFTGSLARYPARALIAWYLILITVGSILLSQSACRSPSAEPIAPIDGIFTATSAACVTGLVVRSTGHDFSLLGQLVILLLIQLGGIGIMTVTTFVALHWMGGESLRQKLTMAESLGTGQEQNLRHVLWTVLRLTALFEVAGFTLLLVRFGIDFPFREAVWRSLFHSVSAFCNAGFTLADESLIAYQGDLWLNLTVMALIVIGGIGFPVLLDLRKNARRSLRDSWRQLQPHSKIVLIGTAGLLAGGALLILLLEWNNALADDSPGRKVLVATFQSVTARTAGFNTVDMVKLTNATLFMLILLMFVGAAPGSTGGGFKVSTFMVLLLHAWSKLRGAQAVNVFRRTIPNETIGRATAVVLLFCLAGTLGLGVLLVMEQGRLPHAARGDVFLDALFEVVSALGTVGLSTGMTPSLSAAGKTLIVLLMFVGRVGPLTLVVVFSRAARVETLKYSAADVLIG